MSKNHPLIQNAQQYMLQYKYCTINSDDRDIKKYPNAAEFEIELPQDYVNVQSVKLNSCSFPTTYDVFAPANNNTIFRFSVNPYYTIASTTYLSDASGNEQLFAVEIETGTYTPTQMATELMNKMNLVVSEYVANINLNAVYYSDFVVEYNEVSKKFWFGNRNSSFTLTNGASLYMNSLLVFTTSCSKRNKYVEYINWGLPYYLGFAQQDVVASVVSNDTQLFYKSQNAWLKPTIIPAGVSHVVIADRKPSLAGPSHFYMELSGMNNMDETMPYSSDQFHAHTNETNGIVNACFAKIPILSNETTPWYNERSESYMLYNPPAEKIRRIRVKMRHHNNQLVAFDQFEYSFVLQFGLFTPQNEKKYSVHIPETINQNR